jgi:hypothetical protein
VPVTARLSKRLYEVLGEDVADELVAWFNTMDVTCCADLRQLNELDYARFDAKLEQRLAAGCGGDDSSTEPDDPEVEGQWNGPINTDVGSGSLALTLTETDGAVSGTRP